MNKRDETTIINEEPSVLPRISERYALGAAVVSAGTPRVLARRRNDWRIRVLSSALLIVAFSLGGVLAYWASQQSGENLAIEETLTGVVTPSPPDRQPPPQRSSGDELIAAEVAPLRAPPAPSASAFRFNPTETRPHVQAPEPPEPPAVAVIDQLPPVTQSPAIDPPEPPAVASIDPTPRVTETPATISPAPEPARPQAQNVSPAPAPSARDDLLELGDSFLASGDVEWARRYYQNAIARGNAKAALAMGWTFDPIYRERSNRSYLTPDPQEAISWYNQAYVMGEREAAKARLDDLYIWLDHQSLTGDSSANNVAATRSAHQRIGSSYAR